MKIVILLIWLAANTRKQLFLAYWWQIKEYRLDRFWVFLKTQDGRKKTEFWFLVIKTTLLFLILLIKLPIFFYFCLLAIESIRLFYEIILRTLRRPKFTARMIFFTLISSSCLWLIFLLLEKSSFGYLLIFDLLGYLTPIIALALTHLFTQIFLKISIKKAQKKLLCYRPVVIVVTGSYGKSSTKHLLYKILNEYQPTLETPASYNTQIGIVQTINRFLKPKTKFLICEVGAYKKGEIEKVCRILNPQYSIITGIAPQHLALFGSMDNLIKAKYEAARAIKPNGVFFLNTSRQSTQPIFLMARKDKIKTITYGFESDREGDYHGWLDNQETLIVKTPKSQLNFDIKINERAFLENLIGAITVAQTLEMPFEKIKTAVEKLLALEEIAKTDQPPSRVKIIDDSYNSNPVGFENALERLGKEKGFKIVVTEGIPELGKLSFEIHKNLAVKLEDVDLIITASAETAKAFSVGTSGLKDKICLVNPREKNHWLSKIQFPAVILLEGRLPQWLIKEIKSI